MNRFRRGLAAVSLSMVVAVGGAGSAFASGGSSTGSGSGGGSASGGGSTATGGTTTVSGKNGGCSPFVAYSLAGSSSSMWIPGPSISATMTLTNCSGGGTPVYSIKMTVSDPSGARPDFVQYGSYCVRGGVTYDVGFVDSQVDAGQSYVVRTEVTASNGQIVDARTGTVTALAV